MKTRILVALLAAGAACAEPVVMTLAKAGKAYVAPPGVSVLDWSDHRSESCRQWLDHHQMPAHFLCIVDSDSVAILYDPPANWKAATNALAGISTNKPAVAARGIAARAKGKALTLPELRDEVARLADAVAELQEGRDR